MLPPQVLIVAQDDFHLSLMSELLAANDVRTLRARSSTQALATILRSQPTMVLLDLDLPEEETSRVMAGLKAQDPDHQIPVMALTDAHHETMAPKVLDACLSARVTKPIDTGAFPRVVMQEIRRRTTHSGRA